MLKQRAADLEHLRDFVCQQFQMRIAVSYLKISLVCQEMGDVKFLYRLKFLFSIYHTNLTKYKFVEGSCY